MHLKKGAPRGSAGMQQHLVVSSDMTDSITTGRTCSQSHWLSITSCDCRYVQYHQAATVKGIAGMQPQSKRKSCSARAVCDLTGDSTHGEGVDMHNEENYWREGNVLEGNITFLCSTHIRPSRMVKVLTCTMRKTIGFQAMC